MDNYDYLSARIVDLEKDNVKLKKLVDDIRLNSLRYLESMTEDLNNRLSKLEVPL